MRKAPVYQDTAKERAYLPSYHMLLLLALLLTVCGPAHGQKPGAPLPPEPPPGASADKPDQTPDFTSSPDRELRARQAINLEKKQHEETVTRAQEVAQLGSELLDAYKVNKTVGAEGAKKLERLERLIRKIRNDSGGLTADVEPKDLPKTVEGLIQRVANQATELRKEVEKTPQHVVSAAMIDRANDLLDLVQHLRKLTR